MATKKNLQDLNEGLGKIRPSNPNFYKLALSDTVNQKANPEGDPNVNACFNFLCGTQLQPHPFGAGKKDDRSQKGRLKLGHPKHNTTWKVTEPRSATGSVCGQEGKTHAKI